VVEVDAFPAPTATEDAATADGVASAGSAVGHTVTGVGGTGVETGMETGDGIWLTIGVAPPAVDDATGAGVVVPKRTRGVTMT